jgi:carboxylesterase
MKKTIIPGAKPFFISGNHIGILVCHGFNGTPQSVEFLSKSLAKKGYTIYAPLLSGHGTHPEDMESYSYSDWIYDVEEAYNFLQQTCSRIFIMGQSMGGALALRVAETKKCAGIITINAALEVPDYDPYQYLEAPRFIPDDNPDIKDPNAKEITYSVVPIKGVKQLLTLMKTTREKLQMVSSPLLLFKSPEDHVVPAYCSQEIYHRVSSRDKKLVSLPNSYHVASLDYDKNQIVKETSAFIKNCIKKEMDSKSLVDFSQCIV